MTKNISELQTQSHGDSLKLEEFITYKINSLSSLMSREGERYLKKNYGIAIPDYRIIVTLATYGELSVREISDHTKMDRAFISRVVSRLVKNEMVNSKPDPDDGRLVLLSTTQKGFELYKTLQPYAQNRQRRLLEVMDPEERQNFLNSVDKLIEHMESQLTSGL